MQIAPEARPQETVDELAGHDQIAQPQRREQRLAEGADIDDASIGIERVQARERLNAIAEVVEQAIVAQFMAQGHYQRHLRRMQAVYAERLEALRQAIAQSGAPLRLRPARSCPTSARRPSSRASRTG